LFRKEGGGNEWVDLDAIISSSQALSKEQILELADIVVGIEKHYGFPCDIEWAMEGGKFYITQSRPITTLSNNNQTDKKEFKFMWGQKQSAMMTEAMMNQVLCSFNEDGNIVSSRVPETMFILSNGVFSHYMPEDSIEKWNKNSEIYASRKYAENIFLGLEQHIKDYYEFCHKIKNLDLASMSNQEIREIFIKYQNFIIRTFQYYGTSNPSGTDFIVSEIRKILQTQIQDGATADDYFITVSTPTEFDETMKERLDFLKLSDQSSVTDEELEKYVRTYPVLFFNTYDRDMVISFLKERLEQQRNSGFTFDEEFEKMKVMLEKVSNDQKKIFEEFSGTRLEEFATLLQRAGLGRYRLKHTWSGGEYLCLDLILEIQKRIGINFDDFIKTYSLSDINDFLETGVMVSAEEVEDRKKCTITHYYDEEKHLHTGDDAIAYKDSRLPVHTSDISLNATTIQGQIANKGKVRGRARLVFVEDLNQFIKDSETFNHDEILVTTMTSPIMIPIIEKAGAIVTDEGGICSHAAISAREFGIPCIIGTENACDLIKTGDLLEVDANQGIVKILEKA